MTSQGASSAVGLPPGRAGAAAASPAGAAARRERDEGRPGQGQPARGEKGVGGPSERYRRRHQGGPGDEQQFRGDRVQAERGSAVALGCQARDDLGPQGRRQRRHGHPGDDNGDPGQGRRCSHRQEDQARRVDRPRADQDPVAVPVRQARGDRAAGDEGDAEHRDRDPGGGEAACPLTEQEQDRQRRASSAPCAR